MATIALSKSTRLGVSRLSLLPTLLPKRLRPRQPLRSIFSFLLFFCPAFVQAAEIRVAVASNFASTLRILVEKFEADSNHKILVIPGSSGKHYAQILNGAPFDVLLAADSLRPSLLEQHGVAKVNSRFTYAIGKLVLWSADTIIANATAVSSEFKGKLAIANPRHAPYGLAAKQTLEHLKRWDELANQLVRGENVTQAFQFVKSGNAELGLVALSQVKNLGMGSYWLIPESHYQAIEQQAVLLRESQAGRQFIGFLSSQPAQKIIQRYGYATR